MNPTAPRIRAGIFLLAGLIGVGLLALRQMGADVVLLRILAIAGGLLVTLLFVTYRALHKTAEAARVHADQAVDAEQGHGK